MALLSIRDIKHKMLLILEAYESCAQEHELPCSHWWIGNNQEGTLSVFDENYCMRTLKALALEGLNIKDCV